MQTLRQIERLWSQGRFTQLFTSLVATRSEAAFANHLQADHPVTATAAMALIRLEELSQSHAQLNRSLLKAILGSQESDGGWGDPMLTALCLRALMINNGGGDAVNRGLDYLGSLQQTSGIWPRIPFRRLPGDSLTTAFILSQLATESKFREAVAFDTVTEWFASHVSVLDIQTRKLWTRISLRSVQWRQAAVQDDQRMAMLWS